MQNMPHEREATRRAKALGEKQLVNFPLRQRWNDKKQEPKSSANKTRDVRDKKSGQRSRHEDDDCGKTPATIPRVPPVRNPYEQNQGRDDRYEEKDVIQVDQNCAATSPEEVRRFAVLSNFAPTRFFLPRAECSVHIKACD
jgi:hypothetical protein